MDDSPLLKALMEKGERSEVPLLRNLEFESFRCKGGGGGEGGLRGTMRKRRQGSSAAAAANKLDRALGEDATAAVSRFAKPWHRLEQSLRWTKIREFLEKEFHQNPDVDEDTYKKMCIDLRSLIQRGLLRSNKDVI
jgi:hypothetical protein